MGKIFNDNHEKNINQKNIKELYFQKKLYINITGLYGFYEIKKCLA